MNSTLERSLSCAQLCQLRCGRGTAWSRRSVAKRVFREATPTGKLGAAIRATESARSDSLFLDAFAPFLAEGHAPASAEEQLVGAVSTRYVDVTLLNGASLHHDTRGDFNQVVLLPDAFDTRPFRLPWLAGTMLFVLGATSEHKECERLLQGREGAQVPRGCLLRRVNADVNKQEAFEDPLLMAGYRADRPSIWALQGSLCYGGIDELDALIADISNCAAFGSIVCGEVSGISQAQCANLLAGNGLLGTVVHVRDEMRAMQRDGGGAEVPGARWLFTSQHQRMSLAEMGMYNDHVAAAEETDEDFFDSARTTIIRRCADGTGLGTHWGVDNKSVHGVTKWGHGGQCATTLHRRNPQTPTPNPTVVRRLPSEQRCSRRST